MNDDGSRGRSRLPLVGGLLDVTRSAASSALSVAVEVPRSVVHAVLDDVIDYLGRADLTPVLTSAIDLNRVLATVDLDALLRRVDLNALLREVDLNALLADVDLNALLDDVDLDALLRDIDLTAVVRRVDINGVLEGVDVDAVLDRTDLVGTAGRVVDGIDLTTLVRDASASVSTEMIGDMRSGSERADDRVDEFVGRVLRRKGGK